MRKVMCMFLGFVALLAFAGCATTKAGSAGELESRVQALENRVQVIEADVQSTGVSAVDSQFDKTSSGVTAETMTKKQIQKALKNAGYYNGVVDGKMGPKTRQSITDFQANVGLKADGVAGKNTKEKLLKYL